MKGYNELMNVLDSQDIQNGLDLTIKNKSDETFNYIDIFDVLVWKLNLKNRSFYLLSSDFGYKDISTSDFKKFLQSIKPCFQEYFVNFFKSYFQLLFENKLQLVEYRFQGFIPFKLAEEDYTLCNICIIPIITNHKVEGFYFTVTPLKNYRNEYPHFSVLKNRKEHKLMTYQLNRKVRISDILTKKQSDVFELILNGYSSTKIAEHLNKKKETVFSYNIRIKEKMTAFFEIDFETVVDSANYYKNCFLLN
mgnify:CR=1 FL=1